MSGTKEAPMPRLPHIHTGIAVPSAEKFPPPPDTVVEFLNNMEPSIPQQIAERGLGHSGTLSSEQVDIVALPHFQREL